jgi:hypothetical protein
MLPWQQCFWGSVILTIEYYIGYKIASGPSGTCGGPIEVRLLEN